MTQRLLEREAVVALSVGAEVTSGPCPMSKPIPHSLSPCRGHITQEMSSSNSKKHLDLEFLAYCPHKPPNWEPRHSHIQILTSPCKGTQQ